ncbi:MAG: Ig-like domain-containing protein [Bacilli bacterium]|nr:Ig-like domain-containing protein [Bacilli bacterium]
MMKRKLLLTLTAALLFSCGATTSSGAGSSMLPSAPIPSSGPTTSADEPVTTSDEPVTTSEETPTTSEDPVPSNETESSLPESSPVDFSSPDTPVSYDASIVFNARKGESARITDFSSIFVATGLGTVSVTSDDNDAAYGNGKNSPAIRMGSSSKSGGIIVSLDSGIAVKKIIVDAEAYGSDTGVLTVSVGSETKSQNITDKAEYEYEFAGSEEILSLSLSAGSKKRVVLYGVYFVLGEVEEVYPTSITLSPAEKKVAVGGHAALTVGYLPSNTNRKIVRFESSAPNIATVDSNGRVTGVSNGEATITATAQGENGDVTATAKIIVSAPADGALERTKMAYTYRDYSDNNIYPLDSAPSLGKANLLVIPVWFKDSSTFIAESKKETVRSDIQKAYAGSAEDTGWHSVKSFYEEESKGKLELDVKVADWYTVNQSYKAFGSGDEGAEATTELVATASDAYFNQFPENQRASKRKEFDADGNGYLDGVMLIYAAPDGASMDNDDLDNLWAYCYWVQDDSLQNPDNPGANVFFWASYDFMYDPSTASSHTGKSSYGYGNNSHCLPDAHTFIHEMGHVFGLDDYYDYGPSSYSDAGGFSMQDHNVGGHDPYSVMALGWGDPYIPTESMKLTIGAFQKTHEVVLLTPEWNDYDSPFDEYLLLELYTPTGLNELDATYSYEAIKGPTATGIRLWHVDSRLHACQKTRTSGGYDYPVYSVDNLTSDVTAGKYGVELAFANSVNSNGYSGVMTKVSSKYDDYDLLQLIRNKKSASLHSTATITNSDLFGNGAVFTMNDYGSQFPNRGKMNKGIDLGWSFTVSITGTGEDATATITLIQE